MDRRRPSADRNPRLRDALLVHQLVPPLNIPVPPDQPGPVHQRERPRGPEELLSEAHGVQLVPDGAGADATGVGGDDGEAGVVEGA